jgi:hypothetical protein
MDSFVVQSSASTSMLSICLRRRPAVLKEVLLVVELLEVVAELEVAELEVVLLVEEEVHAVVDWVQVIV